ncbi:hypothetical protein D0Y65_015231, partial [Glycine soja]
FLDLDQPPHPPPSNKHTNQTPPAHQNKTFIQALDNANKIPLSQLLVSCLKGDTISVTIPEEEYLFGLESCKNHLHGRFLLPKGQWKLTPIGKGFFELAFSSLEDQRKVLFVDSWEISLGLLRVFSWSLDFNSQKVRLSYAQCLIRIVSLPQEYWRPNILFSIPRGVGTPLLLDDAIIKRTFGHYAHVLVDLDLSGELRDQVLVERSGYAFFVTITYERLPHFYFNCKNIGHIVANCKSSIQHAKEPLGHCQGALKNNSKKLLVVY